jgi:hypothetical protein
MTRATAIAVAMSFSFIAGICPAVAGQQVYVYSVMHPIYGDIGTFTDKIDRNSKSTRIDSKLRIAVTFLGVVAFRQDSDTTEIMHGDRLVSLQSVTDKDGQHLEVHGEVQGDRFVVIATGGSYAGPVAISPSDPWVLNRTGDETVVFTDTGRIIKMHVSGGGYDMVSVNGTSVSARHFIVMGDRQQEVWLDNQEIPIMFRTVEDGTAVDFMLQNAHTMAGGAAADPRKAPPSLRKPSGSK